MTFQPSKYSDLGETTALVPVSNPVAEENGVGAGLAVGGTILGLLLIGPFVITPWIVKQFKPEWSYGKRVATGFAVSFGVGALTRIAGAASGKES